MSTTGESSLATHGSEGVACDARERPMIKPLPPVARFLGGCWIILGRRKRRPSAAMGDSAVGD
jgi:hypothetical protein